MRDTEFSWLQCALDRLEFGELNELHLGKLRGGNLTTTVLYSKLSEASLTTRCALGRRRSMSIRQPMRCVTFTWDQFGNHSVQFRLCFNIVGVLRTEPLRQMHL